MRPCGLTPPGGKRPRPRPAGGGFDIEGDNAVADQISLVSPYHGLGVRWVLLAHHKRAGGGCHDQDRVLTVAYTFPAEPGYQPGMRRVAPEQWEILFESLQRIGQGDANQRAVLGGNPMRLARSAWKRAG